MSPRVRPAHRIAWHHGHPLGHVDLSDWAAYEPELLALHVRAGHGTRGVAEGLWVARTGDHRAVAVSRGAGFSCRGVALGLDAGVTTAPPGAGAGTFLLALRPAPAPERECRPAPPCPGEASPNGTDFRSPTRLEWRQVAIGPAQGRCEPPEDELPLARVRRHADGRLDPPDLAVRRVVVPAVRPRVAHGVVSGDALWWYSPEPTTLAAAVGIDAGFDTAPDVFVAVHGFTSPIAGTLGPWPRTAWSTPGVFEVRLGFAAPSGTEAADLTGRILPRLRQAALSWIAVERPSGCGVALSAGIAGVLPLSPVATGTFFTGSAGGGS